MIFGKYDIKIAGWNVYTLEDHLDRKKSGSTKLNPGVVESSQSSRDCSFILSRIQTEIASY